MRPPICRRWTGNAACAASSAASRPSGWKISASEPFFSEFRVSNPASKSSYRVAIRGLGPGGNFCSCPDYATNEFGTCKHIEFTLAPAGEEARRQGGVRARLPAGVFRAVSAQRRQAQRAFSCWNGLPAGAEGGRRRLCSTLARNGMLPDERLGELEQFMALACEVRS